MKLTANKSESEKMINRKQIEFWWGKSNMWFIEEEYCIDKTLSWKWVDIRRLEKDEELLKCFCQQKMSLVLMVSKQFVKCSKETKESKRFNYGVFHCLNENMSVTGNEIGQGDIDSICEMLKKNKTLTSMNLMGENKSLCFIITLLDSIKQVWLLQQKHLFKLMKSRVCVKCWRKTQPWRNCIWTVCFFKSQQWKWGLEMSSLMIDNNFGEDGINALCDMLKVNTTLSKLNLTGEKKCLINHFFFFFGK